MNTTTSPSGADSLPSFMGIAKRKLDDLLVAGWSIDGFSISRESDGTTLRGGITVGGLVFWWTSDAALEAYGTRAVERDRERIKAGIMALTITSESCRGDASVDTARKALALRIVTLIDGHGDLVLNEAGKKLADQLSGGAG